MSCLLTWPLVSHWKLNSHEIIAKSKWNLWCGRAEMLKTKRHQKRNKTKPKGSSAHKYQWPLLFFFNATQWGAVSLGFRFQGIVGQGKVFKRWWCFGCRNEHCLTAKCEVSGSMCHKSYRSRIAKLTVWSSTQVDVNGNLISPSSSMAVSHNAQMSGFPPFKGKLNCFPYWFFPPWDWLASWKELHLLISVTCYTYFHRIRHPSFKIF